MSAAKTTSAPVEARKVTVAELRTIVTDPSELAKGTALADEGGLTHLSRHSAKLFADAAGSGGAPYKTQIAFGDGKVTGRCSCMAARSRPFCKHAAALLVSWARTPEAFLVAEAPPVADAKAKRSALKRSKVDANETRRKGVEQAETLLVELWQTGVDAIAGDRAPQVAELAATLRELGLRRLSSRTLELSGLLDLAARRDGSFAADAYAGLVADMWLTVKKLEKHLAGEALADEHVEELIGKTWTKKDRKRIEGLDLVEVAFRERTTTNDFLVRESRLFDLASGEHYAEKQILPAMIAKRATPKPSYAGRRLRGATGSMFPSFAPRRLDLQGHGEESELDGAGLELALSRALPDVTRALAALAERRRDVFAPPTVPVLVRVDRIVPSHERILFVDEAGGALYLGGGDEVEDAVETALATVTALAVFGDVRLEGALPTLSPLAILGRLSEREGGRLTLLPLGVDEASEEDAGARARRAATAKRDRVATAAVLLGEVRADLAHGFQEGAGSAATSRFVAPLATRLVELKLDKQADALRTMIGAADPAASLDALVRVYQLLGIALARVSSAPRMDRASLVRLPTMPTVAIPRPAAPLSPQAAVAAEARGEIHRFERAYHVAVHYAGLTKLELVTETHRYWGDGDAVSFVLDAAAAEPAKARLAAATVLSGARASAWRPTDARLAKLTAIRVLASDPDPVAKAVLGRVGPTTHDPVLVAFATTALGGPLLPKDKLEALSAMVTGASAQGDRLLAIATLTQAAAVEAIPVIRAALRDRAIGVRKGAAHALAGLGDATSLRTFASWLEAAGTEAATTGSSKAQRQANELARVGAHAIGQLGDVRGAGALLGALGRGFSPTIVREALELLGPWVLEPLLGLVAKDPELVKRAQIPSLVRAFPEEASAGTLCAWIAGAEGDARVGRAKLALDFAAQRADVAASVATWCRDQGGFEGEGKDAKALRRKIEAALTPRPPKKA